MSDANLLVAIRALIGVGAALAMPSTLSLLYTTFTGAARQKAIGLWSVFGMLGPVCGPIIGGILLEHAGWQWLFLINVPVALIAVPLVLLVVRESTSPTQEPLDVPGALLSIAFMGMLVYGLGAGPDAGWLSTRVLLSLGAAVLLLAAFCWREMRAEHPMLDLRLIASRAFAVRRRRRKFRFPEHLREAVGPLGRLCLTGWRLPQARALGSRKPLRSRLEAPFQAHHKAGCSGSGASLTG